MTHHHSSGDDQHDKSAQAPKERQEQICNALYRLELPATIAHCQRSYERELEKAQDARNNLIQVLTDNLIRLTPHFDQGVRQDLDLNDYLNTESEGANNSADATLAKVRLALLRSAQKIIDEILPRPEDQEHLQGILARRDSEVRGFLKSEMGNQFKNLVNEWWNLEGENEGPSDATLRRLISHFADFPPHDSRDIKEKLQKELTEE
jgi:hypothetical protein